MLLMGDEFGRSQQGNNNAYCIDSPLTWVDWNLLESNHLMFEFTRQLIRFRHDHPCLRVNDFTHHGSKYFPSCSFHGTSPWQVNWSDGSKQLAWLMSCDHSENDSLTLFMLPLTPLIMRHGLIYHHYRMAMHGI